MHSELWMGGINLPFISLHLQKEDNKGFSPWSPKLPCFQQKNKWNKFSPLITYWVWTFIKVSINYSFLCKHWERYTHVTLYFHTGKWCNCWTITFIERFKFWFFRTMIIILFGNTLFLVFILNDCCSSCKFKMFRICIQQSESMNFTQIITIVLCLANK